MAKNKQYIDKNTYFKYNIYYMNYEKILTRQQKLLYAIKRILPNYKNQQMEDDIILLKIKILLHDKKNRNI
jgi:uncharacterized membrane protein YgaE (UPF0421/DUF939 family)